MEAVAVFAVADAIGYYEQARALLQEHQRLQTSLSAPEVERLYAHLGRAYAYQKAWQKAKDAYEELLAYAQHQRLPALASMTLNRLATPGGPTDLRQATGANAPRGSLADGADQFRISGRWQKRSGIWHRLRPSCGRIQRAPCLMDEHALSLARGIQDQELEARSLYSLGWFHLRGGDFEEAIHCLEASLALYARPGQRADRFAGAFTCILYHWGSSHPTLDQSRVRSLCAGDCWLLHKCMLGRCSTAFAVARIGLALAQESKNVWVEVISTF